MARLGRKRLALLAVALASALIGAFAYSVDFLEETELDTVDWRFSLRGEEPSSEQLAVVGIDDITFRELDLQWPFPRSVHGEAIDRLSELGVQTIAYDVQFTEPTEIEEDNALIRAVKRAGNVVLATTEVGRGGSTNVLGGDNVVRSVGARAGNTVLEQDPDGGWRRVHHEMQGLESFATVTAEVTTGDPVDPADFGDDGSWIDYRGPPETIPTYSFSDVVQGDVEPSDFEGRIVVVGATAPALQDVHPTSIGGGLMSGAEIQANATATVLDGLPLQSASALVTFVLILLMAFIAPVASLRLSGPYVGAVAVAAVVVLLGLAQLAFNAGTILPVVYPVLALVLSTVGAIVVELRIEKHERETLEDTLGELPIQASQFFISYRREQSAWPGRILCGELTKRFGESSVFIDTDSIDAGQQWPHQIENAIRRSSVVFVLIGPGWLDVRNADGDRRLDDPGDWVRLEIEAALAAPNVVVVPVLLDGATVPDAKDLPESLRPLAERNAVPLTPDGWGREIDDLVESLRAGQLREHFAQRDAIDGGMRV